MNTPFTGIISTKALEKQLKIVDSRLQGLQAEVDELNKIREACMTLLAASGEVTEKRREKKEEAMDESMPVASASPELGDSPSL